MGGGCWSCTYVVVGWQCLEGLSSPSRGVEGSMLGYVNRGVLLRLQHCCGWCVMRCGISVRSWPGADNVTGELHGLSGCERLLVTGQ